MTLNSRPDRRTISVPLAWSWRLSEALPEQRQKFEILGDGQGIHWPDIDEDISIEGMLYGSPARRFSKRANKAAQLGVAPDRATHDG